MAQFYQVLSQSDKSTVDELRQYYPNILENQTVQYVINPEDQQQQFQGQQILVSSDQLMVIENQGQHVIVDQSSVTYQNPQYVLQDSTVEYQDRPQQQVYYMEEVDSDRQVQGEQQIQPPQPIVLNHQLQTPIQNQLTINNSPPKSVLPVRQIQQIQQQTRQVQTQSPVRQILQPRTATQQVQSGQPQIVQQRAVVTQQQPRQPAQAQPSPQIQQQTHTTAQQVRHQTSLQQLQLQQKVPNRTTPSTARSGSATTPTQRLTDVPSLHFTQPELKQSEITEADTQQAVALSDGRIMVLAEYKQLLAEKQRNNAVAAAAAAAAASTAVNQERLEVPALVKYATTTEQAQKPKPSRAGTRGRLRRNNSPRTNVNSNSVQYSLQDNTNTVQQSQRFVPQQQIKLLSQAQQKQNIPQNQYIQQRQQLLQQQAAMRQQQQQMHQPQTQQQQRQAQQQLHLPQQQHPPQPQQQLASQQLPPQQQQQLPPQQQQLHPQPIHQPQYVQPNYIIQPPSQHQQHPHCPLPPYVASSQIQQIIENTPVSEEYSDSIRMLVLLENGEQRLITFTLPKEACTIQEILEQVGVPFHPDTKIECTETSHAGINYLVSVGIQNHENSSLEDMVDAEDNSSQSSSHRADTSTASEAVPPKAPTPEPPTEVEIPRYVTGLLAVCNHCGYTSENFNRCLRCRYKLPEDVKTRPVINSSGTNGKKPDVLKVLQVNQDKKTSPIKGSNCPTSKVTNGAGNKKKKAKIIEPEPVVLTLSSDEEEESSTDNKLSETDQLIRRLSNSSVTLSAIKKEPSASDIQQNTAAEIESAIAVRGGGKEDAVDRPDMSTTLVCRTIRIGSYRYIPNENLVIKSNGIILKVPTPKDQNDIKTIVIEKTHMVKVLVNFQKTLPVVFYYVVPSVGQVIREQLGMVKGSELYFDPLSNEEAYKRITILPENVNEDTKVVFKHIYGKPINIMDELTTKEANDILVKTCPKELSKVIASSGYTEIKQLLIYPPGKGGLPINTEDYLCLAQDQFLNDVIIDFYLKYLVLNLPKNQQEKVHVFSTFFYKRLTTKPVKASRRSHPAELDPTLSPAQKRHARVEKWTKSVNLFEKDFIIIPINENCHWFLAIVCFAGMDGCITMDGKPTRIEPRQKKKKSTTTTIGNVTITTVKQEKEEKAIPCDDGEASDKDEAEGDDSELDSEEDAEDSEPPETPPIERVDKSKRQPIKQPCILIFDSLAGASRSRVVATLRDYLTCEYKAKMGIEKIYTKDVIKGSCPKVPQQTNFTDCGLYLLQYVEQFFKDPIRDYNIPIKQVKEWFEEFVVTKKREDISFLIKDLMLGYGKDISCLPDIAFPTLNGKLVIHSPEDDEDEFMDDFEEEEEEEEMPEDCDTSDLYNDSVNSELQLEADMEPMTNPTPSTSHSQIRITLNQTRKEEKLPDTDIKPSQESANCDGFVEQSVSNIALLKPDVSEIQKHSSRRDTLSYLKAKRINRHKNIDTVDVKKFKPSSD